MSPSESIVELVRLIVREELDRESSGVAVDCGSGGGGDRRGSLMEVRAWNKWLTVLWVCPGLPVSFVLRDSVPWVVFMSAYAIIVSHLAAWRADEPTSTDGGS